MNLREIASDSVVSAVRILLGVLQGVLLIPLITKYLGTAEYGIWATMLAVIGLVSTAGGLHLHGALNRYITRDGLPTTLGTTAILSAGTSTVSAVLIFGTTLLATNYLDSLQNYPSLILACAVAAIVAARIGSKLILNLMRARLHVKRYEIALIIRRALVLLAVMGAISVSHNLVAGLTAMAVVQAAVLFVLIAWVLHSYDLIFSWEAARRYLDYGIPWIPKEVAGSLTSHADKVLILILLGPVAVGVYAVAYGVTQILNQSTTIVNSTVYPRLSSDWEQGHLDEVREFFTKFFTLYVLLVIPAAFGIVLLAEPILRLLATSTVAQRGTAVIPILLIGFAFRGLEDVFAVGVSAGERTRQLGGITFVGAFVNILLNLLLIPTFGIVGAAMATAFVQIFKTSYLYRLLTDDIHLQIPIKQVLQAGSAGVVMASVLYWFGGWISSLQQLLVFPVVGAGVYFAGLYCLGGFPISVKQWTHRLILNRGND